jgi:hypothetical protein
MRAVAIHRSRCAMLLKQRCDGSRTLEVGHVERRGHTSAAERLGVQVSRRRGAGPRVKT